MNTLNQTAIAGTISGEWVTDTFYCVVGFESTKYIFYQKEDAVSYAASMAKQFPAKRYFVLKSIAVVEVETPVNVKELTE